MNGTANPRSMHVGLKWAISSQCPRYSHFKRCMYSAVRTKHPLMPRSMHIGLQRTISSQCRRYSHCTSCMYSAVRTKHPLIQPECLPSMLQPLSFYSTLLLHSSYITYCKTHTEVTSRIDFPLRTKHPFPTIARLACTPQSVRSTP